MKKIVILFSVVALSIFAVHTKRADAFNQDDLDKLLQTNECVECDLSNADLSGVSLVRSVAGHRDGNWIDRLKESAAFIAGVDLVTSITGVDPSLMGANLNNADLRGALLCGADLRKANLSGADLSGSNLEGTNLVGANLRGVNLTGAKLDRACLKNADLTNCYLTGADLIYSNLPGTDFSGARLPGSSQ